MGVVAEAHTAIQSGEDIDINQTKRVPHTRACCTFTSTSKQTRDLIRDTQRYHLKQPQFNFFHLLLHLAHGISCHHLLQEFQP